LFDREQVADKIYDALRRYLTHGDAMRASDDVADIVVEMVAEIEQAASDGKLAKKRYAGPQ